MASVSEVKRPRTKSASRHADWLSLTEISGPFLTLPVLDRIFPQGLDARDPEKGRELRTRFAEWEAEQEKRRPDRATHHRWVRWMLDEGLDYKEGAALAEGQSLPANLEARITQEGETLRPDLALLDPDTKTPVLLIQIYEPSQNLSRVVEGKRWKAEPGTRMAELLRATAVPLGLLGRLRLGSHFPLQAPLGPLCWSTFGSLARREYPVGVERGPAHQGTPLRAPLGLRATKASWRTEWDRTHGTLARTTVWRDRSCGVCHLPAASRGVSRPAYRGSAARPQLVRPGEGTEDTRTLRKSSGG
jgi:hypothetical protein